MATPIAAIYEQGVLKPTQPIDLKEGTQVQLIIVNEQDPAISQSSAAILAAIAALPLEGDSSQFSGRDRDAVLYPTENR
ncbi:MAG: antitoxin family protein [Acaryochloridaceae cyanobacterium RU_4_10]|nr:antitoxin family protein [Acaryochloridaceae cyanobacterium RU_4_10]